MADKPSFANSMWLFNAIFAAMGMLLLAVAGWIGTSVSHIPQIEQKLDDFMKEATGTLSDHETRIRKLEQDDPHQQH
jgi:hypothetical protein